MWQSSPGQLAYKTSLRISSFKGKNGLAYRWQLEAKKKKEFFKLRVKNCIYFFFRGDRRLRRVGEGIEPWDGLSLHMC